MAMNKKEQAALAEAEREVKLHQLCVLLPPLEPDLPPPAYDSGPSAVLGWHFNAHRNSQRVYPAMSGVVRHKLGNHDEHDSSCWRQGSIWLYSTKELAAEAMKRAAVRDAMSDLLNSLERV